MAGNRTDEARAPSWDERVLAQIPSGVDTSQLVENLALTPTERIRKMVRFLELTSAMQRATASGLRGDPRRT